MDSRERVLAAINHQKVDRVPTDIWATPEVWEKLRAHAGAGNDVYGSLRIDGFASFMPRYTGPLAEPGVPGEVVDYWGIRTRPCDYGSGVYHETSHHPLAYAASVDDLERHAWPDPAQFDYAEVRALAQEAHPRRAVGAGYMALFYYHNLVRGFEQSLMDPFADPEFTHGLLGHMADFFYEHHARLFEACEGLIDVAEVTDDFGGQDGPLISLETFREFYRPHLKRFCELCHGHGIKVFHHDDGAMRPFLPDLVEIGIDILNPVQWTCAGMDRKELKQSFGKEICFHGGIDNQDVLPFGTPEEVRRCVRDCIDMLASDGTGYILAPCHNIQPVTPLENILAMYDEAYHYGRY